MPAERSSRPSFASLTWVAMENDLCISSSNDNLPSAYIQKNIMKPSTAPVLVHLDITPRVEAINRDHLQTSTILQTCANPFVFVTQAEFASGYNRVDDKKIIPSEITPLMKKPAEESWWVFLLQLFPSFMLAGIGMVGAGLLLDIVKLWDVFRAVSELFVLVPALLGLKGNLEMTLASRLSTVANMGKIDSTSDWLRLAVGNLALLQCQSSVVGFLAAIYAILTSLITGTTFNSQHALLLCTSSMATASLASLVLGSVMIVVVILSKKINVNPDNISIPIAASLGDLTTLGLLAVVSKFLYLLIENYWWILLTVMLGMILLLPSWFWIARKNEYTKSVLFHGWVPIISAMLISSLGGNILDVAIKNFKGIAAFQPVMNGVGGNLVAVQASRMSTYLHIRSTPGTLPNETQKISLNPFRIFFGKGESSRTALLLMLLVVPGHMLFISTISLFKNGHIFLPIGFIAIYNFAALIQVAILLYLCHILIQLLWKRSVDPDNAAIPYLTALGDLFGTGLLTLAFLALEVFGLPSSSFFK